MTSVVQEIQVVRSLRKELRDLMLPVDILKSVEAIHTCIRSGTDLDGWKKVEWRGPSGGAGSGGFNSNRSGQGNKGGFFGNRQSNNGGSSGNGGSGGNNGGVGDNRSGSSYNAFGSRQRSGFNGRQASEQPVSIPLTNTVITPPTTTAPTNKTAATTTPSVAATSNTAVPSNNGFVSVEGYRSSHPKYVSKFSKSSEKVEDTILNTILLGKLNKFSEQNYNEIAEFITHIIDSGQTDMIKCFMKLVFEKAASEEMFCPLYAKLLSELSARYPVLLSEMANLYSQYMEIFDEVLTNAAENYNEVCKRNVEKKYRRGYSQFLAELIKHDVIDADVFMKTVDKILTQIELNSKTSGAIKLNEEFADCLMKIMKAIQTDFDQTDDSDDERENKIAAIRSNLKGSTVERILPLTVRNAEFVGMSNKARFTFLDIYDGIKKF